jgi:hypothetical protein
MAEGQGGGREGEREGGVSPNPKLAPKGLRPFQNGTRARQKEEA